MVDRIRFVLNGARLELARSDVELRLSGVVPDPIRTHAVLVGGTWFPVRQAFAVATGLDPADCNSHTARRHLQSLGFEVSGVVRTRAATATPVGSSSRTLDTSTPVDESWHTEAAVQATVVAWLVRRGWSIESTADTASREHGIDIVATRAGEQVGVEVKGFPSRWYADPRRASEDKRPLPSTQAGHWYAAAVLAAMRLRGRRPATRSVIALPDFPRYRSLHSETHASLTSSGIEVWWVTREGEVLVADDD